MSGGDVLHHPHCTTVNEPNMLLLWRQNIPAAAAGGRDACRAANSWLAHGADTLLSPAVIRFAAVVSSLQLQLSASKSSSSSSSSSATSSAACSSWRLFALAISAAWRFRHFVRRFWNQTYTHPRTLSMHTPLYNSTLYTRTPLYHCCGHSGHWGHVPL